MTYATLLAIFDLARSMTLRFAFVAKVGRIRILRFHEHALIISIRFSSRRHSVFVFFLRVVRDTTGLSFLLSLFYDRRIKADVFCARTQCGGFHCCTSSGSLFLLSRQLLSVGR